MPTRRNALIIASLLAALAVPAFTGQALAAPAVGEAAPALVATELDNTSFDLSAFHGKVVIVNFWATWCPPCRLEMPDLDIISTHFQPQGLVILSITDESGLTVTPFITQMGYHPQVLFDSDGKVHRLFHVNGIPKNFVFDRDGKLVAQSIDQCTQHQLLMMLAKAGLHP